VSSTYPAGPPLVPSKGGCTIRLAGSRVHSDVTELALQKRGPSKIWPSFEDSNVMQPLVSKYAGIHVPIFWRIYNRCYSKQSFWKGMRVPGQWLFDADNMSAKMLCLEADATSGDANALGLQHCAFYFDERDDAK